MMRPPTAPSTLALAVALLAASGAAARDRPLELRSSSTPMPAAVLAGGADAALDEGRALLAAANPVQAIAAFRTALASNPQSVAALNGLAVAYDRLGRADLARQHFEQALAFEPDAADIAYNLGWSLLKAGQYRDAIAPLQRASAGRDARAAGAARRALAIIAARLEAPAAPPVVLADADVPPAPARIDMVASGEAVLVLAAVPPPVAVRPAAAQRVAAVPVAAAPVAPAAPAAPIATVLAGRLGDAASLTIPASVAEPDPPETVEVALPQPVAPMRPAMPAAPAAPPEAPPPPPRAVVAASGTSNRAIAVPASAWYQRRTTAAVLPATMINRRQRPELPAAPQPVDPKAEIRLAIARLEWLLERLEARDA